MDTSVLIIGGGLSGLVTASALARQGIDFRLIEARNRFGGRILSASSEDKNSSQSNAVDLGPSWFWPAQQNMLQLIHEMKLDDSVFLQPCSGKSVMEYQNGNIDRGTGIAAMADSYRLEGGINSLILKLIDSIPAPSLANNAVATRLSKTPGGISTSLEINGVAHSIESLHVVVALPPRLASASLSFSPQLPDDRIKLMSSVATWMAGQAKFVAIYSKAFWRDGGMSGDGFSQRGPLVEIHDASPQHGGPYALFGFVGLPAHQRRGQLAAIKQVAIEQLVRMYGESAGKPLAVHLQDWAFEQFTSTEADRGPQTGHPSGYRHLKTEWENRIIWSGTECADGHANGYLEGAVESGLRASTNLATQLSGRNSG